MANYQVVRGMRLIEKFPQKHTPKRKRIKVISINKSFNSIRNSYDTIVYYLIEWDQKYPHHKNPDVTLDGLQGQAKLASILKEYEPNLNKL